jgi:sugar (pentulose or hexulose) kinase
MKTPTIAVFDIGKTNKKLFLFDQNYKIVYEKNDTLPETTDEDGDACEDVALLSNWVVESWQEVQRLPGFDIKAVNFSGYGASFVHLGSDLQPVAPLYNYLKSFPEDLKKQFYDAYGSEDVFAVTTASPVLGHLNSGMQLYWLKHQRPSIFAKIKHSLHLPQYLSFLISGQCVSEITSIGCHTNLWDFITNNYHKWVEKEGILEKFPPIASLPNNPANIGTGLHDSSAALIPYLACFDEPFLLISTGTWSISLNPFSDELLTIDELSQDCLNYLTFEGRPVKASRLFLGKEHEDGVLALNKQFHITDDNYYKKIQYNTDYLNVTSPDTFDKAYHQLVAKLVKKQIEAIKLAKGNTAIYKIFIDGGFSKNLIYMNLLANAFADCEVYAASVAQASALGAALAVHHTWNPNKLGNDLVELKRF